ncbi:MAG: hypothetical protein GY940_36235 [bacterium]|nr:hypothetical protein [bacterium]
MKSVVLYLMFLVMVLFAVGHSAPVGQGKTALTPDMVDVNRPIPVSVLNAALTAWQGKEVTVVGYPDFFFEEGSIRKWLKLRGTAEGKEKLIECNMVEEDNERFSRKIPVAITGVIKDWRYEMVRLVKCRLTAKGDKAKVTAKADPYSVDVSKPMAAVDFFKNVKGWQGKEVTVIGQYHSTTTSRLKSGDIIRVDLADPVTRKKAIGCRMKTDPTDWLKENRNNVKIRGIIGAVTFGRAMLEQCELVK